jgi:hypothetical protein
MVEQRLMAKAEIIGTSADGVEAFPPSQREIPVIRRVSVQSR